MYGTLGKDLADHDSAHGMTCDLTEGSSILDLIESLNISRQKVGIISVDGNLVKDSHVLEKGSFVRLYRPIFGG